MRGKFGVKNTFFFKLTGFFLLVFSLGSNSCLFAQCPSNIDFEAGNFNGWQMWLGSVEEQQGTNVINLEPIPQAAPGRQELIGIGSDEATPPGIDPYGGFPTLCPNGSRFSMKLGNAQGGAFAEGASYEFTIPPTATQFSLTYNYAIVLQDPGHFSYQQPTLQFEITNVTDDVKIDCSSFSFIANGGLPGFFLSATNPSGTAVWCKDWSASSINLDGYQGKTIRLFFKTADCVFQAHFGYAYIDVSTDCSSTFDGAAFCPADTAVYVSAPFGYQTYNWTNADYSQVLGHGQTLTLNPPPSTGTIVNVELIPYGGYGCPDTLHANLLDNLVVTADAGPDKGVCGNAGVQIGVPPEKGTVYEWQPAAGLSNSHISNPIATVSATTTYTLTARSLGGGCVETDQAIVNKPLLDNTITLTGSNSYCTGTGQSSILSVTLNDADSIQWYHNGAAIPGEEGIQLTVTETGDYYASLFSDFGCKVSTEKKHIDIYPTPVAAFDIDKVTECYPGNQFNLTNQSTIASGAMQYSWNFGDGITGTSEDITHHYTNSGPFHITLHVTAAGGCFADASKDIIVKPGAAADFSVQSVCMELPLPLTNTTDAPGAAVVNYLWDFGDSHITAVPDPLYIYPLPGTYTIRLSASTPECPQPTVKEIEVVIEAPRPAIRYADVTAIINFPEQLHARAIANSALWSPATYLNTVRSYDPVFKGPVSQLYTITLTTKAGCITVDTLLVKAVKKISINVPSAFTPNGDGSNDFLRPVLFGFKKVIYFRVFNRAGQLLYNAENELPGWDGKWKGTDQGTQAFIWMIKAEDVDGVLHEEKGSALLIR